MKEMEDEDGESDVHVDILTSRFTELLPKDEEANNEDDDDATGDSLELDRHQQCSGCETNAHKNPEQVSEHTLGTLTKKDKENAKGSTCNNQIKGDVLSSVSAELHGTSREVEDVSKGCTGVTQTSAKVELSDSNIDHDQIDSDERPHVVEMSRTKCEETEIDLQEKEEITQKQKNVDRDESSSNSTPKVDQLVHDSGSENQQGSGAAVLDYSGRLLTSDELLNMCKSLHLRRVQESSDSSPQELHTTVGLVSHSV